MSNSNITLTKADKNEFCLYSEEFVFNQLKHISIRVNPFTYILFLFANIFPLNDNTILLFLSVSPTSQINQSGRERKIKYNRGVSMNSN